jgi:hypothetical protein
VCAVTTASASALCVARRAKHPVNGQTRARSHTPDWRTYARTHARTHATRTRARTRRAYLRRLPRLLPPVRRQSWAARLRARRPAAARSQSSW